MHSCSHLVKNKEIIIKKNVRKHMTGQLKVFGKDYQDQCCFENYVSLQSERKC